jgi:hypothetical protein
MPFISIDMRPAAYLSWPPATVTETTQIVENKLEGTGACALCLLNQHRLTRRLRPSESRGTFGLDELPLEFTDRALEIIPPLGHRPREGRVGEMRRVVDAGPILLGTNVGFERVFHSFEVGDHGFDLKGPLASALDAEPPQAIEPLADPAVLGEPFALKIRRLPGRGTLTR